MANLLAWLEEMAEGEEIEAVVIGEMGWGDYGRDGVPDYTEMPKGIVINWDEAKKWLGYEFYSGFGAPGCNAVYAWTATRVIAISQYDGSTEPFSIPRNPTAIMPEMPGG